MIFYKRGIIVLKMRSRRDLKFWVRLEGFGTRRSLWGNVNPL